MSTFLNLVKQKQLVCDGAMGTMLMERGLGTGECPEEWNISHPEIIRSIHSVYFSSGADLVETNSFGGNRFRLGRHGFADKTWEFNFEAARNAVSVRPEGKFVGGSVGPSGEFIQPLGTHTVAEMEEVFAEQISALVEGGVDLIIIETMMDPEEACAAIRASKSIKNTVPVAATMTFENTPSGLFTMMGTSPADAVKKFSDCGADIIGANCGKGIEDMIEIMRQMREVTSLPLLAQANAGLPSVIAGKNVYSETPEERQAGATTLLQLGVNIIGGCCGTGPEHIRAIRRAVDSFKN